RGTPGGRTGAGLRNNVSVGIRYLASWLTGTGAVAIDNLMEDAATAEISRSQVWQWLHNGVTLDDTRGLVTRELVRRVAGEELGRLGAELARLGAEPGRYDAEPGRYNALGRYDAARALFMEVAVADEFVDFLTLPAYERMP